jgi:hypothetical protein
LPACSPCPPDSPCCPHASNEIVRDAKTKIDVGRMLRLRVGKFITASRFRFEKQPCKGSSAPAPSLGDEVRFPVRAYAHAAMLPFARTVSKLRQFGVKGCSFRRWPTQSRFWLEWGSSATGQSLPPTRSCVRSVHSGSISTRPLRRLRAGKTAPLPVLRRLAQLAFDR